MLFVCPHFLRTFFLFEKTKDKVMQLQINNNENLHLSYKIARVVYASTSACSLPAVLAFTSMIQNLSKKLNRSLDDLICDKNLFSCLNELDENNKLLSVPANSPAFLMCVRTAQKMINNNLPDSCNGATRFHHDKDLPDWAKSLGYVLEVDNLLFYR